MLRVRETRGQMNFVLLSYFRYSLKHTYNTETYGCRKVYAMLVWSHDLKFRGNNGKLTVYVHFMG